MAHTRAAALPLLALAAVLMAAGGAAALPVSVDKCEPTRDGCYPTKAALMTLKPTAGPGKAPPRILGLWARQSLCTTGATPDACESGRGCYWDEKAGVCFSTLKAPEAVACPNSWVATFVFCDVLDQTMCTGYKQCTWGTLGDEELCFAADALKEKDKFPNWGMYQRVTFTDSMRLGDCPVANEYRKFMSQCWFTKEPDVCEKNTACQWNDFAGCNVKARTNAAWVTGNNAAVAEAYKACYSIKDPKKCSAAGKVAFDPAVATRIANSVL